MQMVFGKCYEQILLVIVKESEIHLERICLYQDEKEGGLRNKCLIIGMEEQQST